jgi:hypothetical protein
MKCALIIAHDLIVSLVHKLCILDDITCNLELFCKI